MQNKIILSLKPNMYNALIPKIVNYLILYLVIMGFLVWLGFFVTTKLGMVLWEGKPFSLFLLHAFHDLFAMVLIAGLLAAWA